MTSRSVVGLGIVLALGVLGALALLARSSGGAAVAEVRPVRGARSVAGESALLELAPVPAIERELVEAAAAAPEPAARPPLAGAADPGDLASAAEAPADTGCTLRGVVFGADGAPVPTDGARVQAVDASGASRHSRVGRGQYALTRLHPGRWWVTAHAAGREVEDQVTIAAGQREYWLDLNLPPARVVDVFVITEAGEEFDRAARQLQVGPASRVAVVATREEPGVVLAGAELACAPAPQRPVQAGRPWGRLVLEEEGEVYVSLVLHEVVLTTERVPAGGNAVTLLFEPRALQEITATLRLQLTDAGSGAPLGGGMCLLSAGESMNVVISGEDGRIEVQNCSPGLARLELRCGGYESLDREFQLAAGQVTDLGTISLGPALHVAGQVLSPHPAQRILLQVGRHDETTGLTIFDGRIRSSVDEDGCFRVDLTEGVYVLRAIDRQGERPRLSANHLVELAGAPVDGLSIEVLRAVRVVLQPQDETWAGATFALVDRAGLQRTAGVLSGSRPRPVDVPPGDYTLRVRQAGELRFETELHVAGESLEVPLSR